MGLEKENPSTLARFKYVIIHAHFSDRSLNLYTNQIIGTGITPTADYLTMVRQLVIEKLAGRLGYRDLVVGLELGFHGAPITPKEWVQKSILYLQQITTDFSIS
ncbi:MAG: hypothetical protein ABSA01_13825 [Anaerolineales bacterium]